MDADPLSIAQIFKNRVRYCVPVFQRHYVWNEEKQWQPLWNDISSKAQERIEKRQKPYPHYMGAIVLESKDRYLTTKVTINNVIDGQQRLTTLQIFLAAMRDAAQEQGIEKIAKNIEQYLFNDDPDMMEEPEVEIYKVWPTRFDRDVYGDMMSLRSLSEIAKKYKKHFPKGEKRLRKDKTRDIPQLLKAYMFFKDEVLDYIKGQDESIEQADLTPQERFDFLYRAFLEDFRIVVIQLDEGDDPQVIFETLNDRGTPLLAADLIRNFIFYRAEAESKDPNTLYKNYWSPLEREFWSQEITQGRLQKPRLEFFMQHFLGAKTGQEINLIKLFQEYKTFIQGKKPYDSIEVELRDILHFSPLYETLVNPTGHEPLDEFARSLSPWDVSTVFPLVMHIMAADIDEQEKSGMLDDILSYIVRRGICQKTPKSYNKFFLQVVRHLQKQPNGITRHTLQDYLLSHTSDTGIWPSDSEFEAAWMNKPVYSNVPSMRLNYVLRQIEKRLQKDNKFVEDVIFKAALTIEHIMPQSWYEHWPLPDGQRASVNEGTIASHKRYEYQNLIDFGIDDEVSVNGTKEDAINRRNRLLHTFGNLTLLTLNLNGKVGKEPFDVRRPDILKQSALSLNRYFQDIEAWDETAIVKRGEMLFKVAKGIWAHPSHAKEKEEAA